MIEEKIMPESLYIQDVNAVFDKEKICSIVKQIKTQMDFFRATRPLVALCSSDSMLQFFMSVALWEVGANIMYVNPSNGKTYLEKIIEKYCPQYIFFDSQCFEKKYIDDYGITREISFTDKIIRISEKERTNTILDDYHGMVFFTSGTTDFPKAVFRSEENLVNDALSNIETFNIQATDKVLIAVPYGHVYGLGSGVNPFAMQGSGIFLAPPLLTGKKLKRIIEEEKITAIVASPTVYEELLITDVDLQNVRLMLSAGSKLRNRLIEEFKNKYDKYINNMYGSSETGAIATLYNPAGTQVDETNCGKPQSRIEVSCDGTEESSSVIRVRSKSLAQGVIIEGSLCAITDNEGWFTMNDAGYIDAEGYIHLTNRIDDMINIGGEKISARAIESEIEKYCEAVVLAEKNPDGNIYPVAYIKGEYDDIDQLIDALEKKLTSRFLPRLVYRVNAFPINANGKINRNALREGRGCQLLYGKRETE